MKSQGKPFWLILTAMLLLIAAMTDRAQQLPRIPMGHATGFSSDMYFDSPNEEKVQMRLSGSEALPLPGGLLDVKNLKVETFETNGATRIEAESPQCTYRVLEGIAESPGHLEMRSGDGKLRLAGDGYKFVLKHEAMSLNLSNHVHTVIQARLLKP